MDCNRMIRMNAIPVKYGSVKIRKFDLLENRFLIGIDSGSSMTKILFLHKDNQAQLHDDQLDFVTFNHCLFNNADFTDAITWVSERVHFVRGESNYAVHITGIGARFKNEVVESLLGVRTEYIDEMLTIAAGHNIALKQIGLEHLLSRPVEFVNDGKIEGKAFAKFAESLASKFDKTDLEAANGSSKVFPCLIHVYGSASGFFYFDEEGKGDFMSCLLTGGKSFMGLAKCLLDTNNYDEIVRMASEGYRENVDTQIKEILADDINSPYGKFPPELPLFAFGKCMDYNGGTEMFQKEDLAKSLVAFFSLIMIMHSTQIGLLKKISKVYLSGNIFRSEVFKKEMQRILLIFPSLQCEILDFGYFGALGAMFAGNEDKERYYKG